MFSFNSIIFPAPKPMYSNKDLEIDYAASKNSSQSLKSTEKTRQVPFIFLKHYSNDAQYYLIYFHGNAEDCLYASSFINDLQCNLHVNGIVVEYPGYGVYTNYEPSHELIEEDAFNVYNHIKTKFKIDDSRIILFGRSIGSGAAVSLASKVNCRGLILMSPYTSIQQVAKDKAGFLGGLVKDRFQNIDRIKLLGMPCLLIHGKMDNVIEYKHSLDLFNSFNEGQKKQSSLALSDKMTHNDYILEEDILKPIIQMFPFLELKFHDGNQLKQDIMGN